MHLLYVYTVSDADTGLPSKEPLYLYLLADDLRTLVDRSVLKPNSRVPMWRHLGAICKRNKIAPLTPTMCRSIGDGVHTIEGIKRLEAYMTPQKQQELLQALEDHVNAPEKERSEQDDADLLEIMAESKRRTQREVAELDAYFDEQVRNKFADGSTK